jgi:5-(carboxyamino)imidazole ribonucleotide synthase
MYTKLLPFSPLPPGSTIGILGGGQLGRMLAMAAAKLGLKAHVYCPDAHSPAFDVVRESTIAPYEDDAALALFADSVDVVTYEFENVPLQAADFIARHIPLFPDARALEITQDRLREKNFLKELNIPTARFAPVNDRASLAQAVGQVGRPAVMKTRRFGYDGKGQLMLREGLDLEAAIKLIGPQPAILESFVPFSREISVVAARGRDGGLAAYDVTENIHENHILHISRSPASLQAGTCARAIELAGKIMNALDYVGVMGVEMFVVEADGREDLIVNELAPRVHNTGHWTLGGAVTSQFEQHIRAIAGWPLGNPQRLGCVEMTNLIGKDANNWQALAAQSDASLHLYGKGEARSGRKMGHITRVRVDKADKL